MKTRTHSVLLRYEPRPAISPFGTFETCRAGLMMLVIGVDRKWPADSQDGAFDPGDIDPIRPSCTISFAVMEARRDGYGVGFAQQTGRLSTSAVQVRETSSAG